MNGDDISWFLFENSNKSSIERNGYDRQITKNAVISITSSVFIYKILLPTEENFESSATYVENNSPLVLLDEMYRPGNGVEIKRNFYGAWQENIKEGTIQMIDNLLVTNDEKWERRKNLTGVVLKITIAEVIWICLAKLQI